MFVIRMIRWFFGYVVFCGDGPFPERFLNLAVRAGVILWDVRKAGGKFYACVFKSDYRQLRPLAKRAGMRLRIQKKQGFPFLIHHYRARSGLFVGAVAAVALMIFLSMYVWNVEVGGNAQLTPDQVKDAASDAGLVSGMLMKNLNTAAVEQQIMLKLPEVGWVSVNTRGSTVQIELRERVQPPQMVPQNKPCNIKAKYAGQILRMDVKTGNAEVKNGDAVTQGQLLVSGVLVDKYGGTTLKHASVQILAATKHVFSEEIPLEQTVQKPTGKTVTRRSARVFGVDVPLSFIPAPEGNYTRELHSEVVNVAGIKLPVTVLTENWSEQTEVHLSLTEAEAKSQALQKIEERQQKELKDIKITDRQENGRLENGVYKLDVSFYCEEDIGQEEEIQLKN